MKKVMIYCLAAAAILASLAYFSRDQILYNIIAIQYRPDSKFADFVPPEQPNYDDQVAWALYSDPESLNKKAAAFFVHPTTHLSQDSWNAGFSEELANRTVDEIVVPGQASVFSDCCDLFVPRYRQATFWSYFDRTDSGQQARDLAFSDVLQAFEKFLATIGDRPFVLAGHSQGAEHIMTVLSHRVSGNPNLLKRMVAAYAVGTPIDVEAQRARTPDITICDNATEIGCYISWNSLGPNATTWNDQSGAACVNPLTWSTDGALAKAQTNPGSLSITNGRKIEATVAGAQCTNDRLLIPRLESSLFSNQPISLGPENYHLLDYALFYKSIERNATARVDMTAYSPEI